MIYAMQTTDITELPHVTIASGECATKVSSGTDAWNPSLKPGGGGG